MIDIIIAILVYQLIGFIWYSDTLFGTYWKKHNKIKKVKMVPIIAFSVIFSIGIILMLAYIVTLQTTVMQTMALALAFSTGFTLLPMTINALFEQKPAQLILIAAGYHVVAMILATIILTV